MSASTGSAARPRAVHFGAGNIGRGFVGLLLDEAGYQLTFADVSEALIEQLKAADSYTVHEVGEGGREHVISGFSAINSTAEPEALTAAIAEADVVTCAVGPTILKFIAPAVRAGIDARSADQPRLVVMACENAINATDNLKAHVLGEDAADVEAKAVFANTAVDRIVPNQPEGMGLDVNVEPYYEWAIEEPAFDGNPPSIPGATFVPSLAPFIERKLFTVNTGHAATAYFGYGAGIEKISDVLADEQLKAKVYAVLQETKSLLVAKHDFEPEAQEAYVQKILKRFANPELPDTLYISELIAPGTVNTMPEKTLMAYADHGTPGTPVQKAYDDAAAVMQAVRDAGVDLDDVFRVLEEEGVQKFVDSWDELTESVRTQLEDKK